MPQTCRIKQIEPHSSQHHGLFYHIPGSSGHRCHNGPVKASQQIQKGGFAHIGTAYNGCVHPLP
ncbi:hypothetical protein EVA_12497 [gut metagenome]|uniref:Uncharacterized protein n=1 Tax=gut metagenome TaxID=749906 RepID=J9GC90_9ZZZZ